MAELTALGRTDTSVVWPHVRYAAAVNTARAEIALYLYGLDDTHGTRREPTEHDTARSTRPLGLLGRNEGNHAACFPFDNS